MEERKKIEIAAEQTNPMSAEQAKPMSAEQKKEMLIRLMNEKDYRPMKQKELCILLDIPRNKREELKSLLEELVDEGKISLSSHGKYGKPERFLLTGVYTATARGFGFVSVEGRENDIFIPPDETGAALHLDTVQVSVTSGGRVGKREEGRIQKVLSHGLTQVVGTYQKNKKFGFVIPDNKRILKDIFIKPENSMEALHNQKVICTLTGYGDAHSNPEGIVTEILGFNREPGVDILAVAKSFEIPMDFPEEVSEQIKKIPGFVSEADRTGRLDLRALPTVTIDGEDAKDLDDAITLTKEGSIYHLGVHIADVSHYVAEGSPLDREAVKRGTSVYLIDRVIPMLPKELSNGICSLNEGKDRLTLSCLMDLDEKGKLLSHRIAETVINVNHRMTYTKVAAILDGQISEEEKAVYADVLDAFYRMKELSALLRQKRFARGAIDFDFPEAKIILNEKGKPVDIHPYERNIATKLIEDFMLMANETIAENCFWLDLPFVYRIHEKPDPEKMTAFGTFINNFGFSLHFNQGEIYPKELQKLLEKIDGDAAEALISRILLRSMKKAKYSPKNQGHFGLSASYYCHFTSPIRRYPDLQIHRIIKENLNSGMVRTEHYEKLLPQICEQSSLTEVRAQEAEREVEKLKKVQYMRQYLGESFEGVISGVTAHGFYVELKNTVEGMVAVNTLFDDYYTFIAERYQLVGEMTGKVYSLGQRVIVTVNHVDTEMKTIDFLLVNEV